MSDTKAPARRPCGSCPYRRDVPSGVWETSEYDKLAAYDGETFEQPTGLFLCHQADGRICAGWAGTHDMEHSLALRMAAVSDIEESVIEAVRDYASDVPLFRSGTEAAEHVMREVASPGPAADRIIAKVVGRQAALAGRGVP